VGYKVTKHQGCEIVIRGLPHLRLKKGGGGGGGGDPTSIKNQPP